MSDWKRRTKEVLSGTKDPTAVLSAQLRDIVVQDYAQTQFAKMISDIGIQVSGKFTEIVIQAVQDAKK